MVLGSWFSVRFPHGTIRLMRILPNRCGRLAMLLALLLVACDIVTSPSAPGLDSPSASADPTTVSAPTSPLAALPAPELLSRALHAREVGDYDAAAVDL